MSKKVVSLLFSNYKNDNRVFKMATSLAENGYEVTILALCYGDVSELETQGEINVTRLKLKSSKLPSGNKLFGSIKYLEFIFRIILGYRNADIWHCNDFKPFMVGVIARFFNRKLKLVYDCHELESERNGVTSLERSLVLKVEKWFIKKSFVIHVSEGIKNYYKTKYGTSDSQTEIILNTPHISAYVKSNVLKEKLNLLPEDKLYIYQGGLMKGRGIETLLNVFIELNEFHIAFMGYGVFEEKIKLASKEYENIHFVSAVPYDEVVTYTSSADYGLISVENICLSYYYCMPNKLFEYVQAEIPILVNALEDCRNFVEGNGIGMAVKEETPESWRQAVLELSKIDKSEFTSNLKKVKGIYNWQNEEKKLLEFYKKI
tara:strand:+ start:16243 stop:17367 length:1125 start_codon:yes stop_codon:yes gene_type:complete